MPKFSIRHAQISELPRVMLITKLAYKIPYKEGALITKSHEPVDIKIQFSNKNFFALIAVLDGKIVGAVRYKFLESGDIYLYKLAVLKSYRNRKIRSIGNVLVDEVEKIAIKKKCKKLLLDCAQEKELTHYYKDLGYKVDKVKKHLDHHDVYMSKKVKQ